jgi:tetratricopeptide (TPR) repeat protein
VLYILRIAATDYGKESTLLAKSPRPPGDDKESVIAQGSDMTDPRLGPGEGASPAAGRPVTGLSSRMEQLLIAVSVYREAVDQNALLFQLGQHDWTAARAPDRRGPAPPYQAPPDFAELIVGGVAAELLCPVSGNTVSGSTVQAAPMESWIVDPWLAGQLHRQLMAAGRHSELARAHRRAAQYWQWRAAAWPQGRRRDLHDLLEARHHLFTAGDADQGSEVTRVVCAQLHAWGDLGREAELIRSTLDLLPGRSACWATWMHELGAIHQVRGEHDEAERCYSTAGEAFALLSDYRGVSRSQHSLGVLAQARGDYRRAERHYRRCSAAEKKAAGGRPAGSRPSTADSAGADSPDVATVPVQPAIAGSPETHSLDPDEPDGGSPDEARAGSPDEARADSPDEARTDSPDEARTDSPDEARTDSPDEARADSPDEARADSPDEARTDSPDEARTDSPDEARTDSPDEARADSPDEARADSPDETRADSPDEATVPVQPAIGGPPDTNSLNPDQPDGGSPDEAGPPADAGSAEEDEATGAARSTNVPDARRLDDAESQPIRLIPTGGATEPKLDLIASVHKLSTPTLEPVTQVGPLVSGDQRPGLDPGPDRMQSGARRPPLPRRRTGPVLLALGAGAAVIALLGAWFAWPAAPRGGQMPGITRLAAAAWVAAQVSRSAIIGCDPAMCAALEVRGVPGGDLLVLGPNGPADPLGSNVVVATAAVRAEFGSRLVSVYAPQVLATFGSGTGAIEVREVAPDGVPAFITASRSDLQARRQFGTTLLRNRQLDVVATARAEIADGEVDSRLLATLATLADLQPVRVVAFENDDPGAAGGVPLRAVVIAPAGRATSGWDQSVLAFLNSQRPPFRPAAARPAAVAGFRQAVRIQFQSPSPLGLLTTPGSGPEVQSTHH